MGKVTFEIEKVANGFVVNVNGKTHIAGSTQSISKIMTNEVEGLE